MTRRRQLLGLALAWLAVIGIWLAEPAQAAGTTRTEAETCTLGSGWTASTSVTGYSGTGFASGSSSATGVVSCSVTVDTGGGTFILRARASSSILDYEYRLDAGTWTDFGSAAYGNEFLDFPRPSYAGPATPIAITAGAHTIDVRQGSGSASTVRFDFVEVTDTTAPTTTTTVAPTTTTTVAPTTTTTVPVDDGAQLVAPDNTTKQGLGVLVFLASAWFVFKAGR